MHEKTCFNIDTNMKGHYLKVYKNGSCMSCFLMKDNRGRFCNEQRRLDVDKAHLPQRGGQ